MMGLTCVVTLNFTFTRNNGHAVQVVNWFAKYYEKEYDILRSSEISYAINTAINILFKCLLHSTYVYFINIFTVNFIY